MKVRTPDGRQFQGTALQIVKQVVSAMLGADVDDLPPLDPIDRLVAEARRAYGVDLVVSGATDEERARSVIDEMARAGLVARA